MKNATFINDYDYAIDILNYAIAEDVKPSHRFNEILTKFKNGRYYTLQKQSNEDELSKYNAFYRVYKNWKSQMQLAGLSADEVSKLLHVHPWRQLKEGEGTGIEDVKNVNTRRLWKRQSVLKKLNPTRIERIHSQKQNQNKMNENTERENTTPNPE